MKPIILASTSPRRLELFRSLGLPFEAIAPDYEEDNTLPLPPAELVGRLALGKAQSVAAQHPEAIVIAADTLVVLDGRILAKPKSAVEVRSMIESLSGSWSTIVTGLAIIDGSSHTVDSIETGVHFGELTAGQIDQYAKLSEPRDKAGAYGIQLGAAGALFIDRFEGDYLSAVGLPVHTLMLRLTARGIHLLDYAR